MVVACKDCAASFREGDLVENDVGDATCLPSRFSRLSTLPGRVTSNGFSAFTGADK